jgi:amino acid transporter
MVNINGELMVSVHDIMVVLSVLYLLGIVIVGIWWVAGKISGFFTPKTPPDPYRDKTSHQKDNKLLH